MSLFVVHWTLVLIFNNLYISLTINHCCLQIDFFLIHTNLNIHSKFNSSYPFSYIYCKINNQSRRHLSNMNYIWLSNNLASVIFGWTQKHNVYFDKPFINSISETITQGIRNPHVQALLNWTYIYSIYYKSESYCRTHFIINKWCSAIIESVELQQIESNSSASNK